MTFKSVFTTIITKYTFWIGIENMSIKIYPYIKSKISPLSDYIKRYLSQTKSYYSQHYKHGKFLGQRRALSNGHGRSVGIITGAALGFGHAITHVRGKDVTSLAGLALFSFTNPIIGMGLVGYVLGKSVNAAASGFVKGIKRAVGECLPKTLHSGLPTDLFGHK